VFEAGVLQDPYPLRTKTEDGAAAKLHSLPMSGGAIRKLRRRYLHHVDALNKDQTQLQTPAVLREINASAKLDANAVAREFARFAVAYQHCYSRTPGPLHIESAFALLHRRLECVPAREDRVVIAGLTAAVLAGAGIPVHLIVENDLATDYLESSLMPVFKLLGYGLTSVRAEMAPATRIQAYQQAITIVSARECAMDFLRDAVHWPERSNPVTRKLDGLMGAQSQQKNNLLRGLLCAVLLDADSTLIDSARAPIALTRDAHPMHELDALKQALEMVDHLHPDKHYQLIGEGAEVALTELGQQQLTAWAEQLGGSWRVNNAARLMLAAAIVAKKLLKVEVHYRVDRQQVVWLLDERLTPGLAFYGKDFLGRMLALLQGCEINEQREVAARASYQQIFNHYVHLCGMSHSAGALEHEFKKVYGLVCEHRWPEPALVPFDQAFLLANADHRLQWLKTRIANADAAHTWLLLVNDSDALDQLQAGLVESFPALQVLTAGDESDLETVLNTGGLVLAQNQVVEYKLLLQPPVLQCPVHIVVTGRSERQAEDLRHLYWMQRRALKHCPRTLLLCADDELLSDSSKFSLRNMIRFSGRRPGRYLIEHKIRRIQADRAKSLYVTRQQLLAHDETMQGLLSFSGRGLYE